MKAKTRKPSLAPRNPYVAAARFRQAGAHGKSEKALRRTANVAIRNGSVSGQHSELLPRQSQFESESIHQLSSPKPRAVSLPKPAVAGLGKDTALKRFSRFTKNS